MTDADDGTITWRELWRDTSRLLGDRAVARWLCEEASGAEADEFLGDLDRLATEGGVARLDAMTARVRSGEPVQYVLGHWPFRHLDVMVDRRVLIPRPETEQVVEVALALAADRPRPLVVADLGTGSGVLGLALAQELRHDHLAVWLTDVSPDALAVARANLAGIGRAGAAVRVAEGSWFEALPDEVRGRLDLVVSNPPYIALDDPAVEVVVREWEPHLALFGGPDGLDHLRAIATGAAAWLAPGGWLVVEIGSTQARDVVELFEAAGLVEAKVRADLAGRPRVVQAKRAAT